MIRKDAADADSTDCDTKRNAVGTAALLLAEGV